MDIQLGSAMEQRRKLAAAALALAVSAAQPAAGQAIPDGVGSADRPRPEYSPVGVRLGSFFLYPSLTLNASYTDNVFAVEDDESRDGFFTIEPRLRLQSDWGRHSLKLSSYSSSRRFVDNGGENATDAGIEGSGEYDIARNFKVTANGSFERLFENRASIDTNTQTRNPIKYTDSKLGTGTEFTVNRLTTALEFGWQKLNYSDGVTSSGQVIDEDFRDRQVLTGAARFDYELSPGYKLLLRASYDDRNYALDTGSQRFNPVTDLDRDSHGYEIEGGFEFALTRLLYGNVRAGYLSQNYQSSAIDTVSGVTFGADLLWNVTTLTSARLTVDRRVVDTATTVSAGRLVTQYGLGVDHELLRNLIISADGQFARLRFNGLNRTDTETLAQFSARYLMNEYISLVLTAAREARNSPINFIDYRRNTVSLNLKLAL